MLKLTGIEFNNTGKNRYLVLDTNDKITQMVSEEELIGGIQSGLLIGGATLDSNRRLVMQDTYIREAVELFRRLVLPKVSVSMFTQKADAIFSLARQLGIIPVDEVLQVDLQKKVIALKYQNTTLTFDEGKVLESKHYNIMDKNICEVTNKGVLTFSSIDMKIGDTSCTLQDCLDELKFVIKDFDFNKLNYIGITPSNMMFKIVYNRTVYSVKFDTFQKAKADVLKILGMKTTSFELRYYLQHTVQYASTERKIVVTKIAYKDNTYLGNLKKRYKTLQDVYICKDLRGYL